MKSPKPDRPDSPFWNGITNSFETYDRIRIKQAIGKRKMMEDMDEPQELDFNHGL